MFCIFVPGLHNAVIVKGEQDWIQSLHHCIKIGIGGLENLFFPPDFPVIDENNQKYPAERKQIAGQQDNVNETDVAKLKIIFR